MSLARTWQAYPTSYRAKEMAVLMRCIRAGESGSVIGLAGAGFQGAAEDDLAEVLEEFSKYF
jgi:hypothetical protein